MATPQGPVSEVRLLVVHRYVPVKKMRLIPAEKEFAFARKLQGTPAAPSRSDEPGDSGPAARWWQGFEQWAKWQQSGYLVDSDMPKRLTMCLCN
jgi:hypothetical protein